MASILGQTQDAISQTNEGRIGQLEGGDSGNLSALNLAGFFSKKLLDAMRGKLNDDVAGNGDRVIAEIDELFKLPLFADREPFVGNLNRLLEAIGSPGFTKDIFQFPNSILEGTPAPDGGLISFTPVPPDASPSVVSRLVDEAVKGNFSQRGAAIRNLVDLAQGGNKQAAVGMIKVFTDASAIGRGGADILSKRLSQEGALSDNITSEFLRRLKSPGIPQFAAFWIITTFNRIGEAGEEYIDSLSVAAQKSRFPLVRAEAVRALGIIQDLETVDVLRKAIKDRSPEVRDQAASALGNISVAIVDDEKRAEVQADVRNALKDRSPIVRASAAESLVLAFQIDDAAAIVKALSTDKAPESRIMAGRLAAVIADSDAAFEVVSKLITDKLWQVRVSAVLAARELASIDLRFADILQKRIEKKVDPDPRVQGEIQEALAQFDIKPNNTEPIAEFGTGTRTEVPVTETFPVAGNTTIIIDSSGSMTGEKSKIVVGGKLRLVADVARDLAIATLAQLSKQGVTGNVAMSDTRSIEDQSPKIKIGRQKVGGFFATGLRRLDRGTLKKMGTFINQVIAKRKKRVARGPMWDHFSIALRMPKTQNIGLITDGTFSDGLFVFDDTFLRAARDLNRFRMIKVFALRTDRSNRILGPLTEDSGGKVIELKR